MFSEISFVKIITVKSAELAKPIVKTANQQLLQEVPEIAPFLQDGPGKLEALRKLLLACMRSPKPSLMQWLQQKGMPLTQVVPSEEPGAAMPQQKPGSASGLGSGTM